MSKLLQKKQLLTVYNNYLNKFVDNNNTKKRLLNFFEGWLDFYLLIEEKFGYKYISEIINAQQYLSHNKKYYNYRSFSINFDNETSLIDIVNSSTGIYNLKIKNYFLSFAKYHLFKASIFFASYFYPEIKKIRINGSLLGSGIEKFINIISTKVFELRLNNIYLKKNNEGYNFYINDIKNINKNIAQIIPHYLFFDQIEKIKNTNIVIEGSPFELLKKPWYKLLYVNDLKFNSLIHGSGYYTWKNSSIENIEYKLTGNYPTIDKKFFNSLAKKVPNKKILNIKIGFAMRTPDSNILEKISPDFTKHLNDTRRNSKLLYYIENNEVNVRPHPKGVNSAYNNFRKLQNKATSFNILDSDVYILDTLDSSFEFKCIELSIPYIYILDEIPYEKLTNSYVNYLNKLESANGILLYKDLSSVERYIDRIKNSSINLLEICNVNKKRLSLNKHIN